MNTSKTLSMFRTLSCYLLVLMGLFMVGMERAEAATISLNGGDSVNLVQGQSWSDPGGTVSDDTNPAATWNDLVVSHTLGSNVVAGIDPSAEIGTVFTITYTYTQPTTYNFTHKERTVTIVAAPNTGTTQPTTGTTQPTTGTTQPTTGTTQPTTGTTQPSTGTAQPSTAAGAGDGISFKVESRIKFGTIEDLLVGILNIFIVIATPIIVLFIIYAGFLYVTARGNAQQIQQATRALTYAIIGGVLVLGAVALSQIIANVVNAFKA